MLAEIAIKEENLPRQFNSSRQDLEIRKKIGLLGSLENNYSSLNQSWPITANQGTAENENVRDRKGLLKMIKKMSAAKEKLEKEISDLSLEGEPRAELAKLYATIPRSVKIFSRRQFVFF